MAEIWVPLVPALGAVAAAVTAGVFSARARSAQASAERTLELERRLATSKQEIYKPLVDLFRRVLDSSTSGSKPLSDKAMIETLSQFISWVQIYGSDQAVRAVQKFMQTVYSGPPPLVVMRHYGELLLAIRRDIAHPETSVTLVDLLAMRVTDIYAEWADELSLDEEAFYVRHQWSPPWISTDRGES